MKTCNCCQKEYKERPEAARLALEAIAPGYYYECQGVKPNGETCNSTLFWKLDGVLLELFNQESISDLCEESIKEAG